MRTMLKSHSHKFGSNASSVLRRVEKTNTTTQVAWSLFSATYYIIRDLSLSENKGFS